MSDKITGSLNDNELENVSGGLVFYAENISGADKDNLYEVLDEHGDVKARANNYKDAARMAREMGFSDEFTDDFNRVCKMRGQ